MILYFFSFLAGLATVLSPCVIPVLPAILSAGIGKSPFRPLGIIIGLIVSFTFFTLATGYLVSTLGISANFLRYAAIIIIAIFGLILIFPALSDRFAQSTSSIANVGANLQSHFGSSLLLGAALGLVWTPCAGPILAAVTTLVATQNVNLNIILIALSYSIGCGIPLLLIAYGGTWALNAIPFLSRHSEGIRKFFGVIMVLTAVGLYANLEVYLQQAAVQYFPSIQIENIPEIEKELSKINPSEKQSEKGLKAPEIVGITRWINSDPLSLPQLKGKVVLIDFWTYSCINCIRTFPYLKDWYKKYKDAGFVIIGVHTPEFEFEKDPKNVEDATKRFEIVYPVAMDNNYMTWLAYRNHYWPAHYLIDQSGIIRQVHFGEGKYLETENAIRNLLSMSALSEQKEEKKTRTLTPETYLGYLRANSYASDIRVKRDITVAYKFTPPLGDDKVGLTGEWDIADEKITSKNNSNTLTLNFIANRVYLVMNADDPKEVGVLLDGQPIPQKYRTNDMNEQGHIVVHDPRKYDIVNLMGDYGRHTLTLQMPEGVSAYAFTFGDLD